VIFVTTRQLITDKIKRSDKFSLTIRQNKICIAADEKSAERFKIVTQPAIDYNIAMRTIIKKYDVILPLLFGEALEDKIEDYRREIREESAKFLEQQNRGIFATFFGCKRQADNKQTISANTTSCVIC